MLVAVECTNNGVDGGLLVSLSNGVISNSGEQWLYAYEPVYKWNQLTGNEYNMNSPPYGIGNNSDTPNGWENREGFQDDAVWLY